VEEIFNENKTASGLDLSGIVDAEKQKKGTSGVQVSKIRRNRYLEYWRQVFLTNSK
jgi:hypothetical protein